MVGTRINVVEKNAKETVMLLEEFITPDFQIEKDIILVYFNFMSLVLPVSMK